MVNDELPSKPGAISSPRAVQASPLDSVSGRDALSATVAARSVGPDATSPPTGIDAPPPITLLPAGHTTAASLGLTELLRLVEQ